MKKFVVAIVLTLGLLVPASAAAHIDLYNTTISGSPWSNTHVGTGLHLGCWQTTSINPGATIYIHNGGNGANPGAFGLAYKQDASHWHPFQASSVTGPETRQYYYEWINNPGVLATRRVWFDNNSVKAVKFVNQSGPFAVVIRANC